MGKDDGEKEEKDGGHGGWQSEEEGRLHFRDPRSGYIVIPRDAEGESKTESERGERTKEKERTWMRETRRDTGTATEIPDV